MNIPCRVWIAVLLMSLGLSLTFPGTLPGQPNPKEDMPMLEFIVKFKPTVSTDQIASTLKPLEVHQFLSRPLMKEDNIHLVVIESERPAREVLDLIRKNRSVSKAQYNHTLKAQ